MKKIIWLLFIIIPFQVTGKLWQPITPFYAEYIGYYKGVRVGNGSRSLDLKAENKYQLTSRGSVLGFGGSYEDVSQFSYQESTITSLGFIHKQRSLFANKKIIGHPDRQGGLIMEQKGKKVFHALANEKGNMLDAGAFSIQFQTDVKNGEDELNYQYALGDDIDELEFIRVGEEIIKTPIGTFNAIKLLQQSRNKKRQTYLWMVPELDYQLARMEIIRKGKRWAYLELSKLHIDS